MEAPSTFETCKLLSDYTVQQTQKTAIFVLATVRTWNLTWKIKFSSDLMHIFTAILGVKDLLCAECGKQFSNKTCLRIHSRVHTHERPYKCTECNKTFAQNSALYNHRRIHSGLKPFECNVCQRTFHVKHNLKTHMVRHGGDRNFRCWLCPKAFALAQVSTLTYLIWIFCI
jgi:uncharacterized Zn-finger protein